MTIVCPYSTLAPFSTRIAVTTPSSGAATWFISFMTSTMATVSPAETRPPTSTNGGAPGDGARQKSPTEGDSIRVPLAGAASPAGGAVGGTVAEEALATGGNGGSPAATGPAGATLGSTASLSPIRAITAPTGAVSFSPTKISSSVPATSAS